MGETIMIVLVYSPAPLLFFTYCFQLPQTVLAHVDVKKAKTVTILNDKGADERIPIMACSTQDRESLKSTPAGYESQRTIISTWTLDPDFELGSRTWQLVFWTQFNKFFVPMMPGATTVLANTHGTYGLQWH